MNKQALAYTHHDRTSTCLKRPLMAALLLTLSAPAFSADSFQHRMLFSPTESMLKAETKGRIMIYDGLDSASVDRAMDEQFKRIDNMMFIRIHHAEDDGQYSVDDDGC